MSYTTDVPWGLSTLSLSDEWWCLQWSQSRCLETLSDRFGVPEDDVIARLLRAGAETRGRPPSQLTLFEMPPPELKFYRAELVDRETGLVFAWVSGAAYTRRGAGRNARRFIEKDFGVTWERGKRTAPVPILGWPPETNIVEFRPWKPSDRASVRIERSRVRTVGSKVA